MKGDITVYLAIVIFFFVVLISGLLVKPSFKRVAETTATPAPISGSCCDNNECDPTKTGKSLNLKLSDGSEVKYDLLKSNISLEEYIYHLQDTGQTDSDGNPIILNSSETYGGLTRECGGGTDDQLYDSNQGCQTIGNDAIVYVCKENCGPTDPADLDAFGRVNLCRYAANVSCYGHSNTIYDVYFRDSDYQSGGIPDFIKQCNASGSQAATVPETKQIVIEPSPEPGKQNLQLKNIKIANISLNPQSTPWLSPYCKPAIYLYPKEKMDINVKVNAPFGLTHTLPSYPNGGWNVTAFPDGQLLYNGSFLNYLYYESRVPNQAITWPESGYMVEYSQLDAKLNQILTKLGLIEKEKQDFLTYWLKVLPKTNYYFIAVVPEKTINTLSTLKITPNPDSLLRVNLLFKPLEAPMNVNPPSLESISRQGFTVVEWGGIFEKDKDSGFSCLM